MKPTKLEDQITHKTLILTQPNLILKKCVTSSSMNTIVVLWFFSFLWRVVKKLQEFIKLLSYAAKYQSINWSIDWLIWFDESFTKPMWSIEHQRHMKSLQCSPWENTTRHLQSHPHTLLPPHFFIATFSSFCSRWKFGHLVNLKPYLSMWT